MLYVLDGSSIVSVPILVGDYNEAFIGMTDLLAGGDVCFCDEVIDELARTARNEQPYVWARTSAASRAHKGAQYPTIEYVVQDFDAIIDETARDTQEPAALYVVAQALELQRKGREVVVVSQDRMPKPTRASVLEACEHFELRCISLLEFLEEVDLLADDDDFGND